MSRRDCRAEKNLARKLICEDGMTITAVADRLGVAKSAISRWGKAEGWVLASQREKAFQKALAPLSAAPSASGDGLELPTGFKLATIRKDDMKTASENLMRACFEMLMSTKSERAVSKVLEQACKVWLSLEVGRVEGGEMFQVIVPAVTERYGQR